MTGSAFFFRNVINIDDLMKKNTIAINNETRKQKFRVVEHFCMDKQDFLNFQHSFMKTQNFIKDITYKLTMNSEAEYLCVLVYAVDIKYGVLVNSSGYSYARNVAITELGENYGV